MLGDNTNKMTWVGIAVGLVATLGASTMVLFPDAFDTVKSSTSSLVTKFSGANSSDAIVSGSKLTKAKFVALYGESTLGDRDYTTINLNDNQRTRVFDNEKVNSIYSEIAPGAGDASGDIPDSVTISVPSYLQDQTDLPNGRFLAGMSYIFDSNNKSVDVSNIDTSASYHIGLVVIDGSSAKNLKQQFVNFVVTGSQLKDIISDFSSKVGGYVQFSGGNFSDSQDQSFGSDIYSEWSSSSCYSGLDNTFCKLSVDDPQ